jgi:hypothetical protein
MDLAFALPRYSRLTTEPTQVGATTRVDIELFNGFALPKVAAIIEVFQKANSLVDGQHRVVHAMMSRCFRPQRQRSVR